MNDICDITDLDREICWHCGKGLAAAPPREPGLYPDLPEGVYHADTASLSSTGARKLLEDVPAQWLYDRDHPAAVEPNEVMEFGTAVHTLTLGVGADVVEVKAENWKRKAEQERRKELRAAGAIPLLTHQLQAAKAMAHNVRSHPKLARALHYGTPEMSGYWRDSETGVLLRLRTDCLYTAPSGVSIVLDVKTADTADPKRFEKSIEKFGYDQQDDWYSTGLAELLDDRPAFVFGVVAKKPPHFVSVIELRPEWLARGRRRNREAIDIYARCLESGHWPDWGEDIHQADMPAYLLKQEENR
ncbi:PD-(D/E)XK nuclease-like domain-containing protein [Nocardia sp. IFM 10818]